jgi:hypothetical protein
VISNCNIIPNYVYHFHRDDYAFYFEESSPGWRGEVEGQISGAELEALLTPERTWPKAKVRLSVRPICLCVSVCLGASMYVGCKCLLVNPSVHRTICLSMRRPAYHASPQPPFCIFQSCVFLLEKNEARFFSRICTSYSSFDWIYEHFYLCFKMKGVKNTSILDLAFVQTACWPSVQLRLSVLQGAVR